MFEMPHLVECNPWYWDQWLTAVPRHRASAYTTNQPKRYDIARISRVSIFAFFLSLHRTHNSLASKKHFKRLSHCNNTLRISLALKATLYSAPTLPRYTTSLTHKPLIMPLVDETYGGSTSQKDAIQTAHRTSISLVSPLSQARASLRRIRQFFHHRSQQKQQKQDTRSPSLSRTTSFEEVEDMFITKHGRQAGFLAMREDMF
jgi:hypothetical protein